MINSTRGFLETPRKILEGVVNFKSERGVDSEALIESFGLIGMLLCSSLAALRLPSDNGSLNLLYTPTWHRILWFGKNSGFPNPAGSHPMAPLFLLLLAKNPVFQVICALTDF